MSQSESQPPSIPQPAMDAQRLGPPPLTKPPSRSRRVLYAALVVAVVALVVIGALVASGVFPAKNSSSGGGGGSGGSGQVIQGTFIYQPSQTNYSASLTLSPDERDAAAVAYGILTAANGTHYRVLTGGSFPSSTPIALEGSFHLRADASLPGYYDISSMKVNPPSSVPSPDTEVSLTFNSLGVAAANLTFGLSTDPSTPYAYLAFGTYPTFFSNVSLQGVSLNTSIIASILNLNLSWLANLAHTIDPNLPTSLSQVVVVNQTISLPNQDQISGQAQVIITPQNVTAFISALSSSQGSASDSMIVSALNELDEDFLAVCSVTPGHVTYSFLLAPVQLTRASLAGLVSLDIEESYLSVSLVAGNNPNITADGSPVSAFVGVTWDQNPVTASGYAPSSVAGLWGVSTEEAVTLQAPAVGISLSEAGSTLHGMGYSEAQYVMDLATLQNPAVFVLVDPSVVQDPNITASYSSYALAIVPNDELTLQTSVSLYLTLSGVVYNTSHYLSGGCSATSLPACPLFVADTITFGTLHQYLPYQLPSLSTPTFVQTTGFLTGTTMKTVDSWMGGYGGLQNSPVDVGVYDLGYSNGVAGFNLPAIYLTWGQGPTLEVTNNVTEGLYIPTSPATAGWYLSNFDSYIGSLGWGQSTLEMFQSYTSDVQSLVHKSVFNGSVPVPGVLVMMDLWANNSPGQLLASVSGVGTQACVSTLNLSSSLNCIVANQSLSANSASYVFPSFAQVSTSLSGNASASNLTTASCVWIGSLPASCAYSVLACLLAGLCSLSPYHVVNVTVYTCYLVAAGSVASCFPPLPLGSVGSSDVSYTLFWGWVPIFTSASYPLVLSQQAGPTVVLAPPIYPNPLLTGVMDEGETVNFSATATGGSGGYSYSWNGLPSGCVSQNSPSLSCTPQTTGNFSASISVTDSLGHVGTSQDQDFSVNPVLSISSFTASPSALDVGQVTTISVKTSGGTSPILYGYPGWPSICAPSNSSSFSCAALFPGYYTVNATVTDATLATAKATTTITVNPLLTFTATVSTSIVSISGTSLACFPNACPTSAYVNVSASGGAGPFAYSYSGLPPGCSSSNTSSLLCTPNSSSLTYCVPVLGYPCWGWYNITVTVTDSAGAVATTLVPLFLTVTSEPARVPRARLRAGEG